MKYHVGDKFLIDNEIEAVVCHVNNGKAWLSPLSEEDTFRGEKLLLGVCFVVLSEKGRLPDGTKALPISDVSFCGAV